MIAAPAVTVVIAGTRIDASVAARVFDGVVVAPLVPFVREIAERVEGNVAGGRFLITRGDRSIVLVLGDARAISDGTVRRLPVAPFARTGTAYVPLAAVARALGGSVTYDGASRTLAIELTPEPLATMTPFARYVPPPGPLVTFTPKATPQPEVTVSGIPHPRRTPIYVGPDDSRP